MRLRNHAIGLMSLLTLASAGACASQARSATSEAALNTRAPSGGEAMTLADEVETVYGGQIFTVDTDDVSEQDLLVLSRQPVALKEDDKVQIQGQMRTMVVADIERELGIDLDQQLEVEFDGRPIFVADSVYKQPNNPNEDRDAPGTSFGETPQQPQAQNTDVQQPMVVREVVMVIEPTTANDMIGKRIRLESMQVQTVTNGQGFWVGPSHTEQLFVAMPQGQQSKPKKGESVTVEGTLRAVPQPAVARQQWKLGEPHVKLLQQEKLYLEAERIMTGAQAGMQQGGQAQQPGMQQSGQAQPGMQQQGSSQQPGMQQQPGTQQRQQQGSSQQPGMQQRQQQGGSQQPGTTQPGGQTGGQQPRTGTGQ